MEERGRKLLLVEDDEDDIKLTKKAFKKSASEFQIIVARSGEEALRLLATENYQIILLDYKIPGMTGIEVLAEINQLDLDIPVIMVTGQGDEQIAVEIMKQGAYDYIVKTGDYYITLPVIVEKCLEKYKFLREKKRLEQQLIRLERLKAIGELSAAIAHELNNYLNAVSIRAQLLPQLIKGKDLSKALSYTQSINEYIKQMERMIKGLSDFGRPTSVKTRCDFREMLTRSIEFIKPLELYDDIEFTLDIEEELPMLWVDPQQIQQVFINLFKNAAEAAHGRGKVTIRVRANQKDRVLEVAITDEGPGIPEDIKDKIFEPQFTTKEKGYGFGLANSFLIIREHNGWIEVGNGPEKGAIIRFTLPLMEV